MKRILVAVSAAAVLSPVAMTVAPQAASAAPASVTVQTKTSRTTAVRTATSYSWTYAKASVKVGARQKDRNATHLSKLTRNARMPVAQRARLIAPSLQGVPYVWGGTTTRGFDCSGFTSYVFAKSGKKLPRTAAQQARATRPTRHPAPGDLVFFGGRNAHHVGIYMGNHKMIHAPRRGKPVQIVKIWHGASYGKVK